MFRLPMTVAARHRRPSRHRSHRAPLHAMAAGVAVLALATALGACDPDVYTRGNLPTESSLNSIKVGESSQSQVVSALGTPSTTSLFDNQETWFYIGSQTEQFAVWPTKELARQVVAITFDNTGIVDSVRLLNKDDGTQLAIVDRTTPTAGQQMTILQQLLGNLGRFSKDGKK